MLLLSTIGEIGVGLGLYAAIDKSSRYLSQTALNHFSPRLATNVRIHFTVTQLCHVMGILTLRYYHAPLWLQVGYFCANPMQHSYRKYHPMQRKQFDCNAYCFSCMITYLGEQVIEVFIGSKSLGIATGMVLSGLGPTLLQNISVLLPDSSLNTTLSPPQPDYV